MPGARTQQPAASGLASLVEMLTRRPAAPRALAAMVAVILATVVAGCGGSQSAPQAPPSGTAPRASMRPGAARPPLPPPADLAAAPVGRVFSARFGLSVPLPDSDAWRLVPERSSFLVLEHVPSSSRLVVRAWRETENMNRDRCEQSARALRDLPVRNEAGALSRQTVDVPPGFDTVVEVGFAHQAPGEPVTGYVMAFGGWARRCFAYAFTTAAAGPGAERIVGDRLAIMDARSLGGIELRSETAPTIGPQPRGARQR